MKKVLLTGAAGYIGQLLIKHLAHLYDFALTDIRQPANVRGFPFLPADITDLDALRPLCQGIDTVVHLAAASRPNATWEQLLPNNLIGVYNIFQAASEGGCRRVIFPSSIHVVDGYPKDVQVNPHMPVRPLTLYGATKAGGEAMASFYAHQKNLSAICLRIGWVMPRNDHRLRPDFPHLDLVLTHEDLLRLAVASIDAPDDLRFGIFQGISNNRWKRLDMSNTQGLLKYEPQDDAFELAKRNYPAALRRWSGRVRRAVKRRMEF